MSDRREIAAHRRVRLRGWMDEHSVTLTELAGKLGVSRSYVSLLFEPSRFFGEKAARKIEKTLLLPDGYLDMPDGATGGVSEWADVRSMDAGVLALVPRVTLTIKESRPVGVPQSLPPIALAAGKLAARGVTLREGLRLVSVADRSMEPGLEEGDEMLVDTLQSSIQDGQVYEIRHGDRVIVRRLFPRADGRVRLHPDNPSFMDEDVQLGAACAVLGRQVWRGG